MKKLFLILLLLCLSGCSLAQPMTKNIDPQFTPYLQEFAKISNGKYSFSDVVNKIHIEFHDYGNETYGVVGTCNYRVFSKNLVWINKRWWNSGFNSYYNKLDVILHELGHCILYRAHTIKPRDEDKGFVKWLERWLFDLGIYTPKGYLSDGCPSSIMHPYAMWDSCLIRHYNYYADELFGRI